jgi:hypothetical protein
MAGPVTALQQTPGGFTLHLAGGRESRARSVLITTGVSYRRLDAPGLDALLGAGVFYGATTSEHTPSPAGTSSSSVERTPQARPQSTWHATPSRSRSWFAATP